ncbi:MAG: hypothetical protein ABSF64_22540 [Bryobacteraceae bacterium]|jgi:hypothetical protein
MSIRTFAASIVCGLLAIAVQPTSAAAATSGLTGSWQFTLTPTNTATPPVQYPGLATFTSDGSVIETDGSEFLKSVSTTPIVTVSSPGHGIWELGNTPITYVVQYISLVLDTDGALYARNITTMTLSVSSTNTFSGSYTTDQVIGSVTKVVSSGTVSGQLIPHSPLP